MAYPHTQAVQVCPIHHSVPHVPPHVVNLVRCWMLLIPWHALSRRLPYPVMSFRWHITSSEVHSMCPLHHSDQCSKPLLAQCKGRDHTIPIPNALPLNHLPLFRGTSSEAITPIVACQGLQYSVASPQK